MNLNHLKKGKIKMDTGEGRFEKFNDLRELENLRKKYPKSKGIFTIGEILEIRGSKFKVKNITPFGIKLKLLKGELENGS